MVEVASGADVAWDDELWIGPIGTPAGGAVVTAWAQVLGLWLWARSALAR
jgi:hypothetical protein